jgi:hypothetical protein
MKDITAHMRILLSMLSLHLHLSMSLGLSLSMLRLSLCLSYLSPVSRIYIVSASPASR